jgi:V/A-type H+-transporting ATPase subunit G/H
MAGPDGNGQTAARTAHFDVVLRGYNQRQVNERVTRLEFDLKNASRSRDAASAQVAELSKVVAGTRAELDKVKAQLASLAASPISASNVTERVRIMMGLAEEEIADIRKAAVDHANATRAEADRFAGEQKALHQRKNAETDDRRRQLEQQHQQHRIELDKKFEARKAELENEIQELRTKLTAEHNALVAENRAEAERVTTEYDTKAADLEKTRAALEQKYKKYHDDLDKEYDDLRAKLKKEHEQHVVDAKQAAEKIRAEAEAKRAAEEKKLNETLAAKKAESEKLLSELESEALAKVEQLTTEATAKAQKTVREADEHAGKRVSEADARVTALRTMHQSLTEQFAAAQAAVLQAVSVLGPLPDDPRATTAAPKKPEHTQGTSAPTRTNTAAATSTGPTPKRPESAKPETKPANSQKPASTDAPTAKLLIQKKPKDA